ncbi:MAG: hypothetical protein LRY71_00180 [Bacillaceae bacterium]|nr:hypothetical protein [Bacillaceae bacterium]
MGIPRLPKEKHRPSLEETVIDLMESIAKEELALSHIINSEANKIQAFVGHDLDFPTCPTTLEIIDFNYSVNKLLDTILMKEWLLLKKLETVMHIKVTRQCCQCECYMDACCESDPPCKSDYEEEWNIKDEEHSEDTDGETNE